MFKFQKIKEGFWQNKDIQELPYRRGFVFAMYINHLIKQNNLTNSLDNVMLDLFREAPTKRFSSKHFQEITKAYIPHGIASEIKTYIDDGKTIKLDNLVSILPLEKTKIGPFDPGFDLETYSNENIIKNLIKGSNAYQIGLREGDKIIRGNTLSFPKGPDPDQMVTIRTTDNRTFEFRPENTLQKRYIYQFKTELTEEDKIKVKNFFGA